MNSFLPLKIINLHHFNWYMGFILIMMALLLHFLNSYRYLHG
jgi:hypothetical protein